MALLHSPTQAKHTCVTGRPSAELGRSDDVVKPPNRPRLRAGEPRAAIHSWPT